jgi:hypothetical protein
MKAEVAQAITAIAEQMRTIAMRAAVFKYNATQYSFKTCQKV